MAEFKQIIDDALDILKFDGAVPVSYTHLDVYKRQPLYSGRRRRGLSLRAL